MADIAPFCGVRYNLANARAPAERLLAPPYDVISPEERQRLVALDGHNVVRLILPDGEGDDKYANAARQMKAWLDEKVLERDVRPAYYRYHQSFFAEGQSFLRKGFICRIRLHRFDEGIILPHERTLSGPKLDRLKLKRATRTHLSQVFGLYSDRDRKSDAPFAAIEKQAPELEAKTSDGVMQRLWRLEDRTAQQQLTQFFIDKKIYIADGHHRYETMLALRDELRPQFPSSRSLQYGSIFLANMDDPGLVVFPTHRVLHSLQSFDVRALMSRARRFFTVEEGGTEPAGSVRAHLAKLGESAPAFALAHAAGIAYLTLREDADLSQVKSLAAAEVLRGLDVTLLHALIFEELCGIDQKAQTEQRNLRYLKDAAQALAEANASGVQAVFLMNPTKVAQVKAVADAGLVMPQKSTFFYPKLASGLVFNPIIDDV